MQVKKMPEGSGINSMAIVNPDEPHAFRARAEQDRRRRLLLEPHIRPLTIFVRRLRAETGLGAAILASIPAMEGIKARSLFLLEAPGPRAVETGFISRNNPDPTARNWCELLRDAGLPRMSTVLWNVVPWYIGAPSRIRPVRAPDIDASLPYLQRLLGLLKELRILVLVGRKAQWAWNRMRGHVDIQVLSTLHPSNLVLNRYPENRSRILGDLVHVRRQLDQH